MQQLTAESHMGDEDTESKVGQIGQPLTWSSPVPEKIDQPSAAKVVYRLQTTTNDQLFLTPNECFFPKLGLVANGESEVPDIGNLNGGKILCLGRGLGSRRVRTMGLVV